MREPRTNYAHSVTQIGLIGAGNMARALARGWAEPLLCSDGGSGRAREIVAAVGGEAITSVEVARRADIVVLCHKPYQLGVVAAEIGTTHTPVVSVLGATPTASLHAAYPHASVFAVMPNTAVEIRRGVTVYAEADRDPGAVADPDVERQVLELFGRLGVVIAVPERLMGAATSVSGVGPAYQALLAEAQIDAAVRHGIPAPIAARLVVETVAGSAALLEHHGYDTLRVRRDVTSPGGSTARGLAALERAGIRDAFQRAIDAVTTPPAPR